MLYEIRIKGHLSSTWSDWFAGLAVRIETNGETVLTGRLADKAALYGVLNQLQSLNLTLISLTTLPDSPGDSPLGE
jgi:hypothetical protein